MFITKEVLVKKLNEKKGTNMVTVDISNMANMRKTGNPYLGTIKVVTINGVIGYDYERSVNSQLRREGKDADFTAGERAWGTREGNIVTHKGSFYLPIKVEKTSEPKYYFEGKEIDQSLIASFLVVSKPPNTQSALVDPVIVRDIKFESIRKIRLNGEEFELV